MLVPNGELRVIRLEQVYGFVSVTYLYLALLASPLTKAFPNLPGKEKYLYLRRAIGVSSFYFGALHAGVAFFGQLKGFAGLDFLSGRYSLSLLLGVGALFILLLLAATSVDRIIDIMTFRRWKQLHRFIYVAGWLVLGHAVLIGTHFRGSNSIPGRIVFGFVIFLLLLEGLRVDRNLRERFPKLRHFGLTSMLVLHLLFVGFGYLIGRTSNISLQDSHSHVHNSAAQDLKVAVDRHQVEINQVRFPLTDLVANKQQIRFRVTPDFPATDSHCFLIHQESHLYIEGTMSRDPDGELACSLANNTRLFTGGYYAYIRLLDDGQDVTTKFDVDIL